MADLCTLDDVKGYLSITGADAARDALLSTLVSRASDVIRAYTGQTFTAVTEARTYDLNPGGTYQTGPISAVTAVAVNGQTLDTSQYWVYPTYVRTRPAGSSYLYDPLWFQRNLDRSGLVWGGGLQTVSITATYGATYDAATNTVPGALRHIAAITTARLYKMRDAGFTTRIGTTDLGSPEYVDLWTAEEKAVLNMFKSSAPAGLAAV